MFCFVYSAIKKLSELLLMPKEAMRLPEHPAAPARPVMTGKVKLELGMPIGEVRKDCNILF